MPRDSNENLRDQEAEQKKTDKAKEHVQKEAKGFFRSLRDFMADFLDIRYNTDKATTIDSIKGDISFKGHTAWILVCSIFIASIGLNANSPAVVIGAMLISPLMGPILGIGMSVAINDMDTMRRSGINFLLMVLLSVTTAAIYFYFNPLNQDSSELLARTHPDIRDVFIAFFGGLALVIARAKKGTIASVIFGVAIATALMPPLCTAGYGLAKQNWSFLLGAMYLFIINTIFIAFATALVLRILRFPMVKYVNSKKRRSRALIVYALAFLVMLPAIYTFYLVWQESRFMRYANEFVNQEIATYQLSEDTVFMRKLTILEYDTLDNCMIEVVFMGEESIPDGVIRTWESKMKDKDKYPALKNARLRIIQGGEDNHTEEKLKYVRELYESKRAEIATKDQRIKILEDEVSRLSRGQGFNIPFDDLTKEAEVNYNSIAEMSFANTLTTDFVTMDTVAVFLVQWKDSIPRSKIESDYEKLSKWLRLRIKSIDFQLREVKEDL